jgi:phosphatidylserine/phosphatidylglycerophosphate/cardiolipin synthase-like enzyme
MILQPQSIAAATLPDGASADCATTTGDATLLPLVTAAEMFPALEEIVLSAKREVLLAFRIFDARTRLRSDEAKDLGLENWAELLTHVASRGVKIRLLMADFDPVFTDNLHRAAWDSAARFTAHLIDHPNAEIICALHDCTPAPLWQWVFARQIRARMQKLRDAADDRLTAPQRRALQGEYNLRPVTLHQKFALVDGHEAIIGGIDVDERRWDDDSHDRPPGETWHDVSLRITPADRRDAPAIPVIEQIRAHFSECWNRARNTCGTVFSATASDLPSVTTPRRDEDLHLLRTVSTHRTGAMTFGPATDIREHETAHLAAFSKAEHSVYIETQFFRHFPLARALAQRATREPDLQMILVTPTEPERMIFGHSSGMDMRHAQALQLRCLTILRRAFGDRLAVVSPVQPRPAPEGTPLPVEGSGIIYLHSKVSLVDEKTGIVGSANLNGRSLLWDTEASVKFRNPETIRALRQRLATKWLGETPGDPTQAATWVKAAQADADRDPADRTTMVLPYPEERNRRFARYVPVLPAAMF